MLIPLWLVIIGAICTIAFVVSVLFLGVQLWLTTRYPARWPPRDEWRWGG